MKNSFIKNSIVWTLVVSASLLFAATPSLAQEYSDWSAPVPVTAINTAGILEGCPFISKDNKTLFFASTRLPRSGGADIWATVRDDESSPWLPAFNLGAVLNSSANDVCPTYTISGRYLYFVSNRAGGCGFDDIWVARLKNKKDLTSWEAPVNLGCQLNSSSNDITPSLFEDEDGTVYMYFSSNRPGGAGLMDIYVSVQQANGLFGPPVNVTALNTPDNDMRPNIRYRDGLEIFFESNRGAPLGINDLYSSVRASASGPWMPPDNLGPIVNSPLSEGRPSLSFDGTELYFMSNRHDAASDIYVTRRSRLRGQNEK